MDSITSPLKHMLSTRSGVHQIDSSENGSVNQLRWNGNHWYCAGTDGRGLVAYQLWPVPVSRISNPSSLHAWLGRDPPSAVAWAQNDGKIWSSRGRRALGNREPWLDI